MFRIDRRLVKITVPKAREARRHHGEKEGLPEETIDKEQEVGVEGESPEAATSENNMSDDEAMDMARLLMSDAEQEMEDQLQRVIEEARKQAEMMVEGEMEKADKLMDDAFDEANKLVIEAEEKLAEAEKRLENAEKEIEAAKAEAEEIRKNAYDEGYAEGKEAGERDGKQIYEEKLSAQRQEDEAELKNVLDEIAGERERVNSELEEDTVALAVEIVRKIFNPAEKELGTVFTSLIKNALRQMSTDSKFVLRVSPNEYDRFFSSGTGEIELDSGTVVTVSVLRDAALEEGDLIVDTDEMTVNAGVNTQLRYVELAFKELRVES